MNLQIEISHVSKSYEQAGKKIVALQDVNLAIEKGDVYGIIGLSGAGKSTLIRSLAGLIKPSSGKIFFNGNDIGKLEGKHLRAFRQTIGMIFQHFNLLSSRSVEENISYPLEIAKVSKEKQKKRVDELLNLVGLEDKCTSYPSFLSGGEKQRVGIARALANEPDILLCDEATSALDPKTTKEILNLLRRLNQKLGLTIVLITHEMEVVKRICNKVAVLEKGKIVEQGFVSTIFSDPKHETTMSFLQNTSHEIPSSLLTTPSPNKKHLRLRFKGEAAQQPFISQMIKQFDVEANILLGWIDYVQGTTIGTLVVELTAHSGNIHEAILFLQEKGVHCEEMAQ